MNIPKKLNIDLEDGDSVEGAIYTLEAKINELIDLQAKEEASKCICPENSWRSDCPYPHTNTGKPLEETSKKDYTSGSVNVAICDKCDSFYKAVHDKCHPEASKGECDYDKEDYSPEETNKAYIEQVKEVDPPEHEWVYGFEDGTIIDLNRIKGKELADLLDTRFVSKEKIKRVIKAYQHWAEETDRNIYAIPVGILHKKLGLGD